MSGEKLLERLGVEAAALSVFCQRWRISEMALFGSVLRDELGPESDIDVLAASDPEAPWDLWDSTRLEKDLGQLLGRKADVVDSSALRDPFLRNEVLRTCEVDHAA